VNTRSQGHALRGALALAAVVALCGGARAQQPPAPKADEAASQAEDPAALVKRITDDLAAVDKALQEATDADPVKEPLDAARDGHLQAIRDIEELLKQVKYTKSQRGRSQGDPQGEGGRGMKDKPQPQPSDGSTAPTPQQQGSKPKDAKAEEQPAGGKDQKPVSPATATDKPSQDPAQQPPPQDPLGRFQRTDTDARWGLLPPKLQERLMNLHVDDVPERYRAWLESYIHALNRLEQQGSTGEAGGR